MSYERKTDRPGTVEVAIRTLECLRHETDNQHWIKQPGCIYQCSTDWLPLSSQRRKRYERRNQPSKHIP